PSLFGAIRASLSSALEVVRESELTDLRCLIRTENAASVKAPSLPFYALTSILDKFPAVRDRPVFRAGRHVLYDATFAAIQILLAPKPEEADSALIKDLMSTVLSCPG
ncbi:hypothetical protein B0H13DRAFT_1527842, partial [Mycena leptocephala]